MNQHDSELHPVPKLLAAIVDRSERSRLEKILQEKHVRFQFMLNAMGTASSEMLQTLGLSGTEKTLCVCIAPEHKANLLFTSVMERMELTQSGNGIVFIIPVSGIGATLLGAFSKEQQKEGGMDMMEHENEATHLETAHHEIRFELVVAVVDQGFSENVMEAAHHAGARGGTILNARRTGLEEAVKFFGISLQSEKEMVCILIPKSQKKELMQAISKACGMKTDAHGIVLSLPVESCAGIDMAQEDQ